MPADPEKSPGKLPPVVSTAALLIFTFAACQSAHGPRLRWTGPLVTRAVWWLMPQAIARVSPYTESFLAVQGKGDAVRVVPPSDEQYGELIGRYLAEGIEPPIGSIVHFHRETGLWWPSVRTTGWRVGAPFGSTLTEEQIVSALRQAGMANGPAREVRVTFWVVADVIGLILLAVWIRAILYWLLRRRSDRRASAGQCPSCGYDLTGLATAVCPECGRSSAESPPAA